MIPSPGKKSSPEENHLWLENTLKQGEPIALWGVADLGRVRQAEGEFPHLEGAAFPRAICLGQRLSRAVLDGITDRPTLLYLHHYRQVNYLLDRVALRLSSSIQEAGWRALAIPASQIVDWKTREAHLSHRVVGYYAGLGWPGKNNLLVNPRYGSQVRYVTVLTDLPLAPAEPVIADCGDCHQCEMMCPAGAIGKKGEEFSREICSRHIAKVCREERIGHEICGVCVRACPGSGT